MYPINPDALQQFKRNYTFLQKQAISKALCRNIQEALHVADFEYSDGEVIGGAATLSDVSYFVSALEELWK